MKVEKLKFAAALLEMASEEFSNHGCNDLDLRPYFPDLWERRTLMAQYHEENGDPEEYDPSKCTFTHDAAMMSFMAEFLRELAKEES